MSASTQNQALPTLLLLYRDVLNRQIGDLGEVIRARRPQHMSVVLTRDEVKAVPGYLTEDKWLMVSPMYGAGLRLTECLCLRVQDIDFERSEISVRDGKGAKDRPTTLPESVEKLLQDHLREVKATHEKDLAALVGPSVTMLDALDRKYPYAKAAAKSRKPQISQLDSQMSQMASRGPGSEEEAPRRLKAGRICVICAEICAICGFVRDGLARIGASTLPQP